MKCSALTCILLSVLLLLIHAAHGLDYEEDDLDYGMDSFGEDEEEVPEEPRYRTIDFLNEIGEDNFEEHITGQRQAMILWYDEDPSDEESQRLLTEFVDLARLVAQDEQLRSRALVVFVSMRSIPLTDDEIEDEVVNSLTPSQKFAYGFGITTGGSVQYHGWGRTVTRDGMMPVASYGRMAGHFFEVLEDHMREYELFFRDKVMDKFAADLIRATKNAVRNGAAHAAMTQANRKDLPTKRTASLAIYVEIMKEALATKTYSQDEFQKRYDDLKGLVDSGALDETEQLETERRLSVMSSFVIKRTEELKKIKQELIKKHHKPNKEEKKEEL